MILFSVLDHRKAKVGDSVNIILSSQTILNTIIKGITFNKNEDFLIGDNFKEMMYHMCLKFD